MAPAWPSPQGGPACLGSCCHRPSHCPAALSPDPPGASPPSVFLWVGAGGGRGGGEQQPLQPSWPFSRDDAAPRCVPSGSVPAAQRGGPASPTPGEAAAQGYYLNFPTEAPPVTGAQSCTVLSSSQSVEEGPIISLTPGPGHSDSSSCAPAQEEPLYHWPPPFPHSLDTEGLWHWQQVRLPSLRSPLPPPPSIRAQGPQKGSCGLCHTGLAWP